MSVLRKSAGRSVGKATAVAAFGVALALGTTACGAGQISQTANQEPAIDGALGNLGPLQLRDVQILYPAQQTDQVLKAGGPFQLSFIVNNTDPVNPDRLLGIDAPKGGTVSFSAPADVPADQALRAGYPVGLLSPPSTEAAAQPRITVTLQNAGHSVAPGLTTPLTFRFQRAGAVTVNTPVVAGPNQPRRDGIRQAEPPEHIN